jgi:hypothetical protein
MAGATPDKVMRYAVEMICKRTEEEREEAIKEKNNYHFTYGKMHALFWHEISTADKKSIPPDRLKLLENMSKNYQEQTMSMDYDEQQLQETINITIDQIEKRFKEWKLAIYGPEIEERWKKEDTVEENTDMKRRAEKR